MQKAMMYLLILLVLALPALAADKTWTLSTDFDQGILVNLNHSVPDQLQVNTVASTFPYIGVAASVRGTMVRINTDTGAIVGEYWTSPSGMARNPSRTTTDLFGNIWVTNRDEAGWVSANVWGPGLPSSISTQRGSVTKIGLIIGGTRVNADGITPNPVGAYLAPPFTYNTCRDRDADGLIKTSRGLGDIRTWSNVTDGIGGTTALVQDADDECILIFQRTDGYGNRHVSVDAQNNVWVGGYPYYVTAFDKLNGDTGHIMFTFNQQCGGYGGFTDHNGIVWSAGLSQYNLLRYDPSTNTQLCIPNYQSYGLAPDNNGYIWNPLWTWNTVAKFDPAGVIVPGFPKATGGSAGRGVVVTPIDNNVWIANSYSNNVTRMDNNGNLRKLIPVGGQPTGVTVDSNGKVWVTNYDTSNVMRIDPNGGGDGLGAVDLTVNLGAGAYPYNYSDMTGVINIATTMPRGAWIVTYDSGAAATPWGTLVWNTEPQGSVPPGGKITIEARAADSTSALSASEFIPITNGVQFALVGRYIEIRSTLYPNDAHQSPVLSNLALTKRAAAVCDANGDGVVNLTDINLIFSAIGQTATGPTDPRDADGDGKITIYDSRKCVLACNKSKCAL